MEGWQPRILRFARAIALDKFRSFDPANLNSIVHLPIGGEQGLSGLFAGDRVLDFLVVILERAGNPALRESVG